MMLKPMCIALAAMPGVAGVSGASPTFTATAAATGSRNRHRWPGNPVAFGRGVSGVPIPAISGDVCQ